MASFSRKRKLESFDVSEIVYAADAATVPELLQNCHQLKSARKIPKSNISVEQYQTARRVANLLLSILD